ncbi:MAG TPA: hypothetical protein VFU36_10825 [Jatrophihabitans sp.]|nr:hypothetical protein [Jatrophihabitans sp.]
MNATDGPAGDQPEATIFIVQFSDTGLWHAVWSDQDGFVADHDSDSEVEMLAWARERCPVIWIWSPDQQDYVRLPDEK